MYVCICIYLSIYIFIYIYIYIYIYISVCEFVKDKCIHLFTKGCRMQLH